MTIRIYNPEFNFQGVVENQTSLIWTRRYFETGDFELHAPITPDNLVLLKLGNIIWKRDAQEAGVIEEVTLIQNSLQNQIIAKGRFLESYMDRRLIRPTFTFNGKVEVAMRTILSNAVAIPLVQLGTFHDYPETIEFQATYKNLLDYEVKLSKASNIGFRFKPDFTNKTITFETYKGLDKTLRQSDRNRVIFSEKFNNITEASYMENDQIYKNVCYVGGEGEGSDRVYVTVGDDTLTGLERREVFLSASDVSSEELTTTEYENLLKQRGNTLLAEDVFSQVFECSTEANGNFVYKTDYDLGDIVTVRKTSWGVESDLRITEVTEVYEYGAMVVSPTFGTRLPETIDWEDTV